MSSIVHHFNHLYRLVRYHWDWYQIHRRMNEPAEPERQFPRDYLVNNEIKFNAKYFVDNLKHLPEDVEGLRIGDIKLLKENDLIKHELLIGQIMFHDDDRPIGWCVTERGWRGDSKPSSRSSSQSPRPQPVQGSSMLSDATVQSPSNRHEADDTIYIRSTKAFAEIDANVKACNWQCTFKPKPGVAHTFIILILICFSTTKFSPDYTLLERNCYFYAGVVIKLLHMIVGGEIEYCENNEIGKNSFSIVTSDEIAEAAIKIKEIYDEEYIKFMAVRRNVLAELAELADLREERELVRKERELLRGYDGPAQELGMTRAGVACLMDDPDVRDALANAAKKRGGEATTSRPA